MVEEVRQELGVGYVCSLGTQSAVSMCAVWGKGGCHILLQHHKMCPLCSLPCPSDEGVSGTHLIHQIQHQCLMQIITVMNIKEVPYQEVEQVRSGSLCVDIKVSGSVGNC